MFSDEKAHQGENCADLHSLNRNKKSIEFSTLSSTLIPTQKLFTQSLFRFSPPTEIEFSIWRFIDVSAAILNVWIWLQGLKLHQGIVKVRNLISSLSFLDFCRRTFNKCLFCKCFWLKLKLFLPRDCLNRRRVWQQSVYKYFIVFALQLCLCFSIYFSNLLPNWTS